MYMTEVEIKCPLVSIAAGVDDLPSFIAFYSYDPYSNLKFYLHLIVFLWMMSKKFQCYITNLY